jgi:uncharacterized protein YjiS (DUF1127 family)
MQKLHFKYAGAGIICTSYRKNNRQLEASKTMNLIRNYRNWRRYRDTVNELSRLSTRELNDLGIARGDIPFVARKAV